jgi:predicted CXXCH cytochrome family protein
VAALALTIGPLAVWSSVRHLDEARHADALAATAPQAVRSGYATSDRCEACHPAQYHSWHRGYHRTMTQYASPASVRGDFADVTLSDAGDEVHLSRRGDEFYAEMVDPLWQYQVDIGQREVPPGDPRPRVTRRISMVTGSHHMQAYWVPGNEGNSQLSLPFTYLFDDHRWVPRSQVFLHPPEQDHHDEQVWNVSCIRCHTTAGQPLALLPGGGWKIESKLGENGIACEACHGPAEAHVAANQNPARRYWLHLRGAGDPTIVNPARLPAARGSEVCGQCHSLTDVSQDIELGEGKTYVAGAELEKSQPLLRPLHPTPALERAIAEDPLYLRNYFWADGTIRVSSRDYSGLVESRCMQSGKLWCGSCHSLHDSDPVNLLARGAEADAACASCHPRIAAAPEAHTHHAGASEGSRCASCHMPYTVYGLLKGIRNHRIDSPRITDRAAALAQAGDERPNACNLCHVDRSLGWAAQQLARWYGQPVPARLAGAAAPGDDTPAAVAWLMSGDAVLRALAAWHLGWQAGAQPAAVRPALPYLVTALDDPYAAVRYVAGHAVQNIVPGAAFDYLAPPAARNAAAAAIMKRWLADHPMTERETQQINARLQALLARRDNTPVRAME